MNSKFVNLVKSLLVGKTNKISGEFIDSLFVGFIGFSIDFIGLFIFTEYFKINYLISGVIAVFLSLTITYLLSISWVFKNRTIKNPVYEFMIFAIIGLVSLGLNLLFLWFFTEFMQVYYLISKIIGAVLVFIWNFGMRKMILFRKD